LKDVVDFVKEERLPRLDVSLAFAIKGTRDGCELGIFRKSVKDTACNYLFN